MAPAQPGNPTGILAFLHPDTAGIYAALDKENIHVMHHAGRIRIAVAGYNTAEDVNRLLAVLATTIK
jgi:selenocysteine lyase/cysteine desulfurase